MKYKVVTLGCKVNTYEAEALKTLFDKKGYTNDEENPDVIVVNTCSVTSTSDQKCRQKIRGLIKAHPNAVMVVMGCYAQVGFKVISEIPGVNIIVGTNNRHLIPELVDKYLFDHKQINIVEEAKRDFKYESLSVTSYYENTRAFLKIQDGCDNFCSYCIIPYARGRMRSRNKNEVLKEVSQLLDNGFKEIVLTGIHTAGYGKDFPDYKFHDLVRDILQDKRLKRLRISSIEESEITPELIDLFKEYDALARHLHIPLQSGSDGVLKRMNRKYDATSFWYKIAGIKASVPDIAITTDIIVGFPGETEEEFEETMHLAEQCGFAKIHVFPYSPREGTPAAKMKNQVPPDIKKGRVKRLMSLSNKLENAYQKKFEGKTLSVLFEEYDSALDMYKGHSSNYLLVYKKSDVNLHNQMVDVEYHKI